MNESALQWGVNEEGVEHLALRVTEKGKKDRIVPVPPEAALLLRAYMGHGDLEAIDRNVDADRVLWVTTNNLASARTNTTVNAGGSRRAPWRR